MGLSVKVFCEIKVTSKAHERFVAFVIDEKWRYKVKNLQYGKSYTGKMLYSGVSYAYSSHKALRKDIISLIGRYDLLDESNEIRWDKLPSDMAFFDFIDYADNEGCLDWGVSQKIYRDFDKYYSKAESVMGKYMFSRYKEWHETFKLAARYNGVVVFG